jgi:aldose 1-epimerase
VELERENFRTSRGGAQTDLYTLRNRNGLVARITNYGARIEQLLVPDRHGELGDVVLGYDSIEAAIAGQPSMGAFIGRYANRIANARFTLGEKHLRLVPNSGAHTLHGGASGSRFAVFSARQLNDASVEMTHVFRDGDDGFPGNMPLRVVYSLTDENALVIDYEATTDKRTVCNLTSHAFFNLAGGGDILGHVMTIHAKRFAPLNESLVPTGELRSVEGTPMDFTVPAKIGARIGEDDPQLALARGYDHDYALDGSGDGITRAARVHEPGSGRTMDVFCTQPALRFYSGNHLEGQVPRDVGKGGRVYESRAGFCLEPQHFADSVHQPDFPSTVLEPGGRYAGRTIYGFSCISYPRM